MKLERTYQRSSPGTIKAHVKRIILRLLLPYGRNSEKIETMFLTKYIVKNCEKYFDPPVPCHVTMIKFSFILYILILKSRAKAIVEIERINSTGKQSSIISMHIKEILLLYVDVECV